MSTEKQRAAAQANGRKSQGPTTTEGKATSAGNALKHGVTARKYLTPDESLEEFETLCAALCDHHKPGNAIEYEMVMNITMGHWRLRRLLRAEEKMLEGTSLAEVFRADHDNRAKNMNAYEATNRKSIKQWEDMLADYRKRRGPTATVATPTISTPTVIEERPGSTENADAKAATGIGNDNAKAKKEAHPGQNQKTNPISTAGSASTTETSGGPVAVATAPKEAPPTVHCPPRGLQENAICTPFRQGFDVVYRR